jgi:hypothetical protein
MQDFAPSNFLCAPCAAHLSAKIFLQALAHQFDMSLTKRGNGCAAWGGPSRTETLNATTGTASAQSFRDLSALAPKANTRDANMNVHCGLKADIGADFANSLAASPNGVA